MGFKEQMCCCEYKTTRGEDGNFYKSDKDGNFEMKNTFDEDGKVVKTSKQPINKDAIMGPIERGAKGTWDGIRNNSEKLSPFSRKEKPLDKPTDGGPHKNDNNAVQGKQDITEHGSSLENIDNCTKRFFTICFVS